MGNKFASGRNSIAECDRCGQRFKLVELRKEIQKQRLYDLMVCNVCWDPDQPQLMLGTFPVDDPQGVRNPRPDLSYQVSGLLSDGYQGDGMKKNSGLARKANPFFRCVLQVLADGATICQ